MNDKFKDFTANEIVDYIKRKRVEDDDEWLAIDQWIREFLKSNPPEEEKRIFAPLGWAECVGMMCDGITRWRNSICIKCKKQNGHDKFCCSVYEKNKKQLGGIPNEIWTNENAECLYFEQLQ